MMYAREHGSLFKERQQRNVDNPHMQREVWSPPLIVSLRYFVLVGLGSFVVCTHSTEKLHALEIYGGQTVVNASMSTDVAWMPSDVTFSDQFVGSMEMLGGQAVVNAAIPTHVTHITSSTSGSDFVPEDGTPSNLGSFSIVINAGATLAGNAPALLAFQRAAEQWEARIADPITVTVDADLANLGSPTTIGQASSVIVSGIGYTNVRNLMVTDAADEPDDGIVASLPTLAQFSAILPAGIGLAGDIAANKANLKALGVTGLDTTPFTPTDGTITFNTQFSFDFDNSDGVGNGLVDFETVAAHEIGHVLGFTSAVDAVDLLVDMGQTADINPRTWDMFRFENDEAGNDPSNPGEFTTFSRFLTPSGDAISDQITVPWGTLNVDEFGLSTGVTQGDGRQASHWKDNNLFAGPPPPIGIMDPTLESGPSSNAIVPISEVDWRMADLIGYEIAPIPEPTSGTLLSMALLAVVLASGRSFPR